jgi:hypothetical protein
MKIVAANRIWTAQSKQIMASASNDLRFALRSFRKSPVFTAVAVLSLALGIGANTAIFTLLDQILLRLLPVKNPHELVLLTMKGFHYGGNWGGNALSFPMYRDFKANNRVFTEMFCRFPVMGELVSGTGDGDLYATRPSILRLHISERTLAGGLAARLLFRPKTHEQQTAQATGDEKSRGRFWRGLHLDRCGRYIKIRACFRHSFCSERVRLPRLTRLAKRTDDWMREDLARSTMGHAQLSNLYTIEIKCDGYPSHRLVRN